MNSKAVAAADLDARVWTSWIVNLSSLAVVCFPLLFVMPVVVNK